MKLRALIILAVGCLVAAAAQDDAKKDAEKLQGKWEAAEGGPPDGQLVFGGNSFTVGTKEKVLYKGSFKVDPTKAPKAIDMTVGEDNEKGQFKGKTSLGIYEVDGDTLKWCANEPGKEQRPTEFVNEEKGENYLLVTFKRVKN